jgi:methylglutaconyl-CoA hydratase
MNTALKISTHGGVHTITLSRPDVRNAFNDEVIAELKNAFADLPAQPDAPTVFAKLRDLRNSW